MVIHQLRHVFIAGRNHDLTGVGGSLHRQRANHIVRFHTADTDQRQSHCTNRVVDRLDLLSQFFRHRWAISLVFRVDLVAKRGTFCIEHHHHLIAGIVRHQFANHANDTFGRTGIEAFGIRERR